MFVPFQVNLNMHFQHTEAVVLDGRHAIFFGLLLLDIVKFVAGVAQINITVKPAVLELEDFVFGLTHDVRDPFCCLKAGCAVRHNQVFCGDKYGCLSAPVRVVVHLLEGGACNWE